MSSPQKKLPKKGSSKPTASKDRPSSSHDDGDYAVRHSSRSSDKSASKSKGSGHNATVSAGGSAGSARGSGSPQDLPRSVRHAPPEMRIAIRRRQNNESAKRSREKKQEEAQEMFNQILDNSDRIEKLEKQVDELSSILKPKEHKSSTRKGKRSSGSSYAPYPDPGSPSDKSPFGDPF